MNARRRSFYMMVAAVAVATLACSPLGGAAALQTQTPAVTAGTQAVTRAPTSAGASATGTAVHVTATAAATAAEGEPTATVGEATAAQSDATTVPEATVDTSAAQLTVPPLLTALAATAMAAKGSLRQWAAAAKASSQYSDPAWAASQAANAPDSSTECSDQQTAWASEQNSGAETLELTYTTTVVPVAVNIYENDAPGSIIKVDVLEANGTAHTIYTGLPLPTLQCPRITSIGITGVSSPVNKVKIYFDQSLIHNWDEIDAVELVGNP